MTTRSVSKKPEDFPRLSAEEKLQILAEYAHLAPSSHNTQPWLFELANNSVRILPNLSRSLPIADPRDRQLYLSLGAAAANLEAAGRAFGLKAEIRQEPLETGMAISFHYQNLEPQKPDLGLLEALSTRHSNRLAFSPAPLPGDFTKKAMQIAESKQASLVFITDDRQKNAIRQIVSASLKEAFSDKAFTKELSGWIKPSQKKHRDGMVGYNLGVPWLISFLLPAMIRRFNLSKLQQKMHDAWLRHSPAHAVLAVSRDEIPQWIAAGWAFEEIAIAAEMAGLRIGVIGAPIEIGSHHQDIRSALGISDRPVMLFRIGYGPADRKYSPRLPLEQVIRRL